MQYILSQSEFDSLTPVKRLQDRNEALAVAMSIILHVSGFECGKGYCSECPVWKYGQQEVEHSKKAVHRYLCPRGKRLPK